MSTLLNESKGGDQAKETVAKYIRRSSIRVDFDKHDLTSEEDVLEYVEALKKAYMERIRQNLRITL